MKKSKVTIGLALAVFLLVTGVATTSVFATEGSQNSTPKTQEQIDAYKKEMEAKKAEMIKEYKERQAAETKGMTPAQIREYKLEEARKAGQTVAEERKENSEEKLAEQKAQREEKRAEKLAKFVEVLAEKVGKYYDRLSQLSEKLQTRITKLKEEGVDMAAAQAKLDEADETLEVAYQNALAIIEEIKGSDISLEDGLGTVIAKVKELKNPFRSSLEAYKEVAKEIRAALSETREDKVEATKESDR